MLMVFWQMLDQYKLEYATYLESLPEDKRQEELQNNQPKRKSNTVKPIPYRPVSKNVKPLMSPFVRNPLYSLTLI